MTQSPPKYKRHWRNLLLDVPLQLRMISMVVGAAAVMGALLGVFLWRTSETLLVEAQGAVEARSQAAQTSRELGQASLSNELLGNFDDPAFAAKLKKLSDEVDAKYEAERKGIVAQQQRLEDQQRLLLRLLAGGLLLFLAVLGGVTVVISHRFAGPIFHLRRVMRAVAQGKLRVTSRLRRGDQLQELFGEFVTTVDALRSQEAELHAAVAKLAQRPELAPEVRGELARLEQILASRVADEMENPAQAKA